jgi:hypothetical protein
VPHGFPEDMDGLAVHDHHHDKHQGTIEHHFGGEDLPQAWFTSRGSPLLLVVSSGDGSVGSAYPESRCLVPLQPVPRLRFAAHGLLIC